MYVISGGLSYFRSHGQRVAGTLDSVSGFPCRSHLIPSVRAMTYQPPGERNRPAAGGRADSAV
jgi:hypothetical protein